MSDGAAISVRRYAIGKGPCLAISHGNGFAIDGYRAFWEPLAERFELAIFDARNHGANPAIGADGHHYLQMAIDLGSVAASLRERIGGRPLVGVFHSMSGRAAMKHAVQYGFPWDALVLFDPPNVPPPDHRLYEQMRAFELRLVEWACARPERFATIEAAVQSFRESRATSRWVPQAIVDMGHAVIQPAASGGFELTCRRELEALIYLAALTLDLWPSARQFGGPTKLVGADPALRGGPPTGIANQALGTEEGFDYTMVPETGHLLQIERPDACRDVMIEFLAKHGLA